MGTVPALDGVVGTVLDKLLEKSGVPESISIYAASYCIQDHITEATATAQCFSHGSSKFDIATGVRIALAVCYALGITFSITGLAFWLHCVWRDSGRSRYRAIACTCFACGVIGVASITTTVLAYAVYMVFARNVPQAILSVNFGAEFFALTWSACVCLAVGLALMGSWKLPHAQQLH